MAWTWKTWLEFVLRIYVVFLSTVNHIAQEEALERFQKVFLKVILGPVYVNYQFWNIETLRIRREKLWLSFAKKCLKPQRHFAIFPVEPVVHNHQLRNAELFTVNYARTEKYRKSAIPYMQRKLNSLWKNLILFCDKTHDIFNYILMRMLIIL